MKSVLTMSTSGEVGTLRLALALLFCVAVQVAAVDKTDETDAGKLDVKDDPAEFEKRLLNLADKDENHQLVEGVTAGELVKLKTINLSDCTRRNMFDRMYVCDMLRNEATMKEYCLQCLEQSARYCARELLGQNPDQFNMLQRPLVKWSRIKAMSKKERRLWVKLLDLPKNDRKRLVDHLDWEINCQGNTRGPGERRAYELYESERLNRQQLLERIAETKKMMSGEVATHLSQAKDKAQTDLIDGVTVADLLSMNDISQGHCLPEELVRRNEQCCNTTPIPQIRLLCRSMIRTFAYACMNSFTDDDPFDHWWLGVYDATQVRSDLSDMLRSANDHAMTNLESYLKLDIAQQRHHFEEFMSKDMKKGGKE